MTTKVGLIDVPYVLVDKTQTCKNAKLTQQSTGFHAVSYTHLTLPTKA